MLSSPVSAVKVRAGRALVAEGFAQEVAAHPTSYTDQFLERTLKG